MGIFELIYNWALELVGYTDTVPSEWLLPQFALLLSYIMMGITLYACWWLTKWVIRFISTKFFWDM